jgi:hypothetical protein
MIRFMHPTACEVQVPTDEIEKLLERRAVPGFTGSVSLNLKLCAEAALAVSFTTEEREVQGGKNYPRSPEMHFGPGDAQPTERVLKVRQHLARNRDRFRLMVKPTRIVANYVDGNLNSLELITVG